MSGPIHLKIFLSSPGDVADERAAIVRMIKDELPYDALLRNRVTFDVLAWDDRAQRVALLAGQSGQASVDRALGLPADCDLTVVVVRTRLGTPPDDRPAKPDGTPWRSGTEWELWNARNAGRDVLVCRGPTEREVDFRDPEQVQQQLDQARLANEFFTELTAQKTVINNYKDVAELTGLVGQQVKRLARERLDATSAPPSETASGPELADNNLLLRNPDFVGREGVLAELRRLLTAGQGPAVLTQAITGLGGIGKTQTARAYAHRHLADYELIWWLRAESPATLAADYATLAGPLGLDPDTADQAKLNAAIRQRLQSRSAWLLIFDNVEDPKLPREWLPGTGGGHSLITSRRTDWQDLAKPLSLPVMPEDEAIAILTGGSDIQILSPAEHAAASDLARELGYLPLALAQARAYMVETGRSLASYLSLFRSSRPADFADDRPSLDYPASYATTWAISINAAAAACPGARPLLELLAFFAPDPLSVGVLNTWPATLPVELRDEHARDDAIAALRRYSLIDVERGRISVHRLVQAVTRDELTEIASKDLILSAIPLACKALPEPPTDHLHWPIYAALLPHTITVANWSEKYKVGLADTTTAINRIALYHYSRASWDDAELLLLRALSVAEGEIGKDHPYLIRILNNLAAVYQERDRHHSARQLYKRSIIIAGKSLDVNRTILANTLSNLSSLYEKRKYYKQAECLLVNANAIHRHIGDDSSLQALTIIHNLGSLYRLTGRPDLAEPLLRYAVAGGCKILKYKHPTLAIWLDNLGCFYGDQGRYRKGQFLLRRSISILMECYGYMHPTLARSMSNLAKLYQENGRGLEAEQLLVQAIEIGEKTLDPGHPEHLARIRSLTNLYTAVGRHVVVEKVRKRYL